MENYDGDSSFKSLNLDKSEKSLFICNAMTALDEPTKQRIISIIERAAKGKANKYESISNNQLMDDCFEDDESESDDQEKQDDCDNDDNCDDALCCEVDWKYSRGFRNYFCLYRKKYCGKPCYESLNSAQQHYRDLCGTEKALFRNLDRRDPGCPKKCDPCGNSK